MKCWSCVAQDVIGYIKKASVYFAVCQECLDLFEEEGALLHLKKQTKR